jgi:PhnB protein
MPSVNIYLSFDGNCEEAFRFYQSVFGGEFRYVGKYSDMPPQEDQPPLPDEAKNRIMHISLPIGGESVLMGCDIVRGWGPPIVQGTNFSVSVNAGSREEADRLFAGLSEGGSITMHMGDTFWGAYFGMFTDRYGIGWMVSFEQGEGGM